MSDSNLFPESVFQVSKLGIDDPQALRAIETLLLGSQSLEEDVNDLAAKVARARRALFPTCILESTSTQTISHNTETALSFPGTEIADNDFMHSTVSNDNRIFIRTPGRYAITGFAEFDKNTTGDRRIRVRLNGDTSGTGLYKFTNLVTTDPTNLPVSTVQDLDKDDFLSLTVFQNSGGDLDVQPNQSFAVFRVGDQAQLR